MKALQFKNCEAIWFDKRKYNYKYLLSEILLNFFFLRPITILNFDNINGFILNILSDSKIAGFLPIPWKRKHWIAITKIDNG